MSEKDFTIRLNAAGAPEAKKAVDDVVEATNRATEAGKDAADANRDAARAAAAKAEADRRSAIETVKAVDAEIAAEKAATARKKAADEAAGALKREAEAALELDKAQVKEEASARRAANAAEQLALRKGKTADFALGRADAVFDAVRGGQSPAAALWSERGRYAAEASAMKQLAEEAERAKRRTEELAPPLENAATKTRGLASAGRLLANAFLPDMWVSRTISGGRAIIAVLSGLSAGALALTGIVGGALVGAFFLFRSVLKDNEEAAEKLNRTTEEGNRLAEEAIQSHDALRASLGGSIENITTLTKQSEGYAASMEQVNDTIDRQIALEKRRIDLTASEEDLAIRRKHEPGIASAEKAATAAENERTKARSDWAAKIRDAQNPEARRELERQRDADLAGRDDRIASLRADVSAKRGALDDDRAAAKDRHAVESAKADERGAFQKASSAVHQQTLDLKSLEEAKEKSAVADNSVAEAEREFRSSRGLGHHDGILAMTPKDRDAKLGTLTEDVTRAKARAKELDEKMESGVSFAEFSKYGWNAWRMRPVSRKEIADERRQLGDPAANLGTLGKLKDAYEAAAEAKKNLKDARTAEMKSAAAASDAQMAWDDSKRRTTVVTGDAELAAGARIRATAGRNTEAASAATVRESAAADRASVTRGVRNVGAAAWNLTHGPDARAPGGDASQMGVLQGKMDGAEDAALQVMNGNAAALGSLERSMTGIVETLKAMRADESTLRRFEALEAQVRDLKSSSRESRN